MPFLRIKAYGLAEVDYLLVKSMLSLADKSLTQKWKLVEKGNIDLSIYSLDTDEGVNAWQQHKDGAVTVLASEENIHNNESLVLRKPLRSKNFANVLNKIAEQINSDDIVKTSIPAEKLTEKLIKKPSFLSNLSQSAMWVASASIDRLYATFIFTIESSFNSSNSSPIKFP